MDIRKAHLIVGLAGVAAFVLSGQMMHWMMQVRFMDMAPRLFVRATHIFLMWSAVLNVVLGCFYSGSAARVPRILQNIASLMILASPLLIAGSFLIEPYTPELYRPLSRFGNVLAFGGTFLFFLAHLLQGRRAPAMTPS